MGKLQQSVSEGVAGLAAFIKAAAFFAPMQRIPSINKAKDNVR